MASAANTFIPIGVFWDIENCCVPKWRSALLVTQRIREKFFRSCHREVEFMCVCDTSKESKLIVQELNSAQVNVVHIDAVSKNAADDKLRQNIRRFADTHTPPATIVLISSDVNFASDLSDLRYRRKFDIILIHSLQTHDALVVCATEHYLYEDLVKDVAPRTPAKCCDGQSELLVTGFSQHVDANRLKSKLQQLSSNCGGRVVSITKFYALLKFSSQTVADRARRRMDGEDVYGAKIQVDFSVQSPTTQSASATELPDSKSSKSGVSVQKCGSPKGNYRDGWQGRSPQNGKRKKTSPDRVLPTDKKTQANITSTATCKTNLNDEGNSTSMTSDPSVTIATTPVAQQLAATVMNQVAKETQNSQDTTSANSQQLQGVVKKFSHEQKSSRQLLMLQQQMYQEGQEPIFDPCHSTQFYSHYQETRSYYGYGTHQWQQNSGYHDNQYYQSGYKRRNNYQNGPSADVSQTYSSNTFCPIRSTTPTDSVTSSSPSDLDLQVGLEYPGSVELIVSNLDYNISSREWKQILLTTFQPHVKILHIDVQLQPDNTSLGSIRVSSVEEARFAISQFHRKKIGYKRIHVTLRNDDSAQAAGNVRTEAVALLSEAKGNVLPLFKFIELFDKRYHRSISVSELYKMQDTIEIREQGGAGRMVYLLPSPANTPPPPDVSDVEVKDILEQALCPIHCPEGSTAHAEAMNCSMLPYVRLQLKTFAAQVHSLLMSHDGDMPLMSFPACYSAEVAPLVWVLEGGVPLEHLIGCVPGIQILVSKSGVKKVSWAENKPPATVEFGRQCNSPLLTQQLSQMSREMLDLLKHSPNCRMPFSKFIPSYHHHFGRQCRVADYGYSKLMELFEAIPHVLQVLGSGDRRILTLTHRAQVRRFTADVLRLLKTIPGKQLYLSALPDAFYNLTNRTWNITEYGVCCVEDMLAEIPATTVTVTSDGVDTIISIPRKDQTPEEMERTKLFALEVVDLLKHNNQCRMLFNKFIPAYHHHFGRQCRVSDYGFSKLLDLFEAIPHVVEVLDEGEEKLIKLTESELRKVVGEQIVTLLKLKKVQCLPLDDLILTFTLHYGFPLPLHDFCVDTIQDLMAKLKHVLKVELYDNKKYIVLSDRSSAPPLARQVLQLMMDQSGGSLPLMELCSRYKTTFGVYPDVKKIKEELLDYVQVSGDDESGVISLTALQLLARDIRLLLQLHGKVSLSQFDQLFRAQFGSEIKPALYGFPTTVALLLAIPHVVSIKGKGYRRVVHLSGDLQGTLPIIDECYTRPDSDTPSNDSGSALTDDDQSTVPPEPRKLSPFDLLSATVPSAVPSPDLRPEYLAEHQDLITLDPKTALDIRDELWRITEEERKCQRTPLCKTPTSELLQFAAQCLPPPADKNPSPSEGVSSSEAAAQDFLNLLKNGWWSASPSQLVEVSKTINSNCSVEATTDVVVPTHTGQVEYTDSQSQTTDIPETQSATDKDYKPIPGPDSVDITSGGQQEKLVTAAADTHRETFASREEASLSTEETLTEQLEDVEVSDVLRKLTSKLSYESTGQDITRQHQCVTSDCMCYEAVFRQEHPLETSSIKSDTSVGNDSPLVSPSKAAMRARPGSRTSSISEASPQRPSPRRSRMAAKFEQPITIL